MERIFDVPAHPLLIHFPAVAIPVLSLMALAIVLVPRFRSEWKLLVVALSGAVVVSTFLAAGSGQALADVLSYGPEYDEDISTHRTLGLTLRWFVLGLGLTSVLLSVLGSPDRAHPLSGTPAVALRLIVTAFAILSLIWVVRTGHEGASFHWGELDNTAAATEDPAETATASETTETTAAPDTTAAPEATAAAGPVDGMAVYEANCARCHGTDGGGGRGPSLQGIADRKPDAQEQITQTVNGGRGMPAFGNQLSDEEIAAAVEYLRTFPAAES